MDWILIRGLGRHADHWGNFPAILEKELNCQTFSLNLPGMGNEYDKSPTSIKEITDLVRNRWLKSRDPQKEYSIMAISLGGMVAMDWSARYPQDFKSLITINSSSRTGTTLFERLQPEAMKTISKLIFKTSPRDREEAILRLTVNTALMDDKLINKWGEIGKAMNLNRICFMKQLIAASTFSLPKKIDIPFTVLASEKDRLANVKCSRVLAKHFGASLEIHPTAGHDIPTDDPNWVLSYVKEASDSNSKLNSSK
jgi:pimeloyl-ACP methyl ester carboxylesterase